MRFEKWQALGNDYLIVEREELPFELTPARVRRLCEPHVGVCADGVVLLSPPSNGADVADLRIFNPDGSEAELSGNGVREAVLYLRRRGWTASDSFSVGTPARSVHPQITGPDSCRVDMGTARLRSKDYPDGPEDGRGALTLLAAGDYAGSWSFQHVSIGNPQCALRVGDERALEQLDLATLGPVIEGHPLFPNRTNVSWYAELGPGPPARIRARIFERGVGETLSSGTGACGAALAYALEAGLLDGTEGRASVLVSLDGGELEVELDRELRVHLTGWARAVFEGQLSPELLRELERGG